MDLLAIDPGCDRSAFVLWNGSKILEKGILPNQDLLSYLNQPVAPVCLVEMVASYGMPVGAEVFQTVRWIGRFEERAFAAGMDVNLIYRKDVKLHHCQDSRARDSNIRQALVDKYGAPGTKKQPGLTYGVSKDVWSAFAIATFWSESLDLHPST